MPSPEMFNDTFLECYRARLEPTDIRVEIVVDSVVPVKLSLALVTGAQLKHALTTPPQGAMLAMDMTAETAAHLYSEIRARFREMDWPLPPEAIEQAEFQKRVPANPRRSVRDKKDW